ncbi:MAG: 4-hydroxy-tetrahydrodipicolinate reductase [Candidatus Eisenbacteria bacterium]|uniref:4-hydroxy-tetrahydrodipicolinate reductase n=1 Tax=Eiseniibacteriota bacterium TaxID=2212470 RepID=A0A948W5D5_UNCEI|nr:4-hydroxy-tetrahydrodipicolinate reductase [Candidatus Eisenbacteria bacterium]MBU1947591.1 4-hydroxy-tetrahydrodipicolinate reductase [Candidatus Eisenbacteria bacterium]MBU2690294.1 4-hydroxy-tetrahydrodipicolinate reductase [Candidatus Eisenbacteria bacterium]
MRVDSADRVLRFVLAGAAGRMGRAIEGLAVEDPLLTIVALVDSHEIEDDRWRRRLGEVADPADGVIEFTHAGGLAAIATVCAERGWPLVSGTTSLTEEDHAGLARAAETIPILQASNLSLGIALMRRCLASIGREAPEGTELEILEIHHGAKRDAPSGTARTLYETWSQARGGHAIKKEGRSGLAGPRSPEEVGIHALRLGEVVGEHRCYLALPGGERLELAHSVTRRESFARGAFLALRRLVGRPPGFYSVDEIFLD